MGLDKGDALREIDAATKEGRPAKLIDADLNGASLDGASLNDASLTGASLYRASLTRASLYGTQGIIEIGGEDWSLYLIRWADSPRIKGGICRWFETRAAADTHWRKHHNREHGALMLAKLDAAWMIARHLGWPGT